MNHIITPLSRYQNLNRQICLLRGHRIEWHLILDVADRFSIQFKRDWEWIHQHYFPNRDTPGEDRCLVRLNWFIENATINDDDRYCFFNDDDACAPEFFDQIDLYPDDVVIVSMKRGDHVPPMGLPHGTDTLVAAPENMKPCCVSLEQLVVRGRLLKKLRFPVRGAGDGELIQRVAEEHLVKYLPETFVWFNYLEPGRWDV